MLAIFCSDCCWITIIYSDFCWIIIFCSDYCLIIIFWLLLDHQFLLWLLLDYRSVLWLQLDYFIVLLLLLGYCMLYLAAMSYPVFRGGICNRLLIYLPGSRGSVETAKSRHWRSVCITCTHTPKHAPSASFQVWNPCCVGCWVNVVEMMAVMKHTWCMLSCTHNHYMLWCIWLPY